MIAIFEPRYFSFGKFRPEQLGRRCSDLVFFKIGYFGFECFEFWGLIRFIPIRIECLVLATMNYLAIIFAPDAGADFKVKTSFGKTAADMSEATDNKQIAKMINEKKKLIHEENLRKLNEAGDADTSIDIGNM